MNAKQKVAALVALVVGLGVASAFLLIPFNNCGPPVVGVFNEPPDPLVPMIVTRPATPSTPAARLSARQCWQGSKDRVMAGGVGLLITAVGGLAAYGILNEHEQDGGDRTG